MITVCEEVFLLMLDYDTGRPNARLPHRCLRTALGGSLLMDLALDDRIDTDLDGLFVVDTAPLEEPVLDRALARIAADGGHRPIDHWVGVFAEDYEAVSPLLTDRLAERGIVMRGLGGALLVMGTRHWVENGGPVRDVRQRLAGVLLDDEVPDPRDIMIVSLADACDLWPGLLDEDSRARLGPKIAQIAQMDLIGQAVTRAIDQHPEWSGAGKPRQASDRSSAGSSAALA